MFSFNSTIETRLDAVPNFPASIVKNEPMLFNCDYAHSMLLGSVVTHAFLAALGQDICLRPDFVLDTRVHMLMKGWWPCIPGWHHDDVPRTRSDGQPDYAAPAYRSKHALALIGDDVCSTEFAIGRCEMPDVPLGQTIYERWDAEVTRLVTGGDLELYQPKPSTIVLFDCDTFHQGVPATGSGWRWFGRASWDTHRKPTNEVRRQAQVYLPFPKAGW